MPLSTFWGATVDRSVQGQLTLTLEGVSVTVPWDATKATKSDLYALFMLLNDYGPIKEVMSGDLWDYRCQYVRFAWKVNALNDYAGTLPGNQRKPYTDKAARLAIERDKFKALAGE